MIINNGYIEEIGKELTTIYKTREAISNREFLINTELLLCDIILDFYELKNVHGLHKKLQEMFASTGNVSIENLILEDASVQPKYEYIETEERCDSYAAYTVTDKFSDIFLGALNEFLHFARMHGYSYSDEYISIYIYNLCKDKIILGNIEDDEINFELDTFKKYNIRLEMIIWKPTESDEKPGCHFDINIIDRKEDDKNE